MTLVNIINKIKFYLLLEMPAAAPPQAAGAENGGAPKTELQELQLKAQQTTDEVFFSLNNF